MTINFQGFAQCGIRIHSSPEP